MEKCPDISEGDLNDFLIMLSLILAREPLWIRPSFSYVVPSTFPSSNCGNFPQRTTFQHEHGLRILKLKMKASF
jgi:hypothetical protein